MANALVWVAFWMKTCFTSRPRQEVVLKTSQMFLHGSMGHFEMILEPYRTLFVLSLESPSFWLLALWFFVLFFLNTKNQLRVWQFFVLPIASELYNNKHFTVFLLISLMYVAWIFNAELIFAYDIIEPIERLWNKINKPWNKRVIKDSLSVELIFHIIVI